mgnify:CR=1 FL=1
MSGVGSFTGDKVNIAKEMSEKQRLEGVKKASKKTLEYF